MVSQDFGFVFPGADHTSQAFLHLSYACGSAIADLFSASHVSSHGAYSSQLQLDARACISGFVILEVMQESKESTLIKGLFYKAVVSR